MTALPPFIDLPFDQISPILFVSFAIIANVFPAIPEEVFLLLFGYFLNTDPGLYSFWEIVPMLIVGFPAIDSFIYYLSHRGSKIIKYISRKILGADIIEKEGLLSKHIVKTIFLSRFLLHFRVLGPITSGTMHYPYRKFILVDLLALVVYVPIVMGLGYYFTDRIENIVNGANVLNNIMFGAIIILASIIIILRLRKIFMSIIRGTINIINGEKNGPNN